MKIKALMTILLSALLLAGCPAKEQLHPSVESSNKTLKVAAMGDIMMGTENLLPADGGLGTFKGVVGYLKDCHLVFGNLEGPLTDRGAPTKDTSSGRSFVFRTPPSYVAHLKEAGFNLLSLANNHANDYGPEGQRQTRELLDQAGIKYAGSEGEIAWLTVDDFEVAMIALAPNAGCQNINDIPGAVALVKKIAAQNPQAIILASLHGGAEGGSQTHTPQGMEIFLEEKRGNLRELSHQLIDAGADLIIGHGPHVPRGLEIYKDRLIAYSLGNFATAAGIRVAGKNGLAPLLLVDLLADGQLAEGSIISMRQFTAGQPHYDEKQEAVQLMYQVSATDFTQPGLDAQGKIPPGDKPQK